MKYLFTYFYGNFTKLVIVLGLFFCIVTSEETFKCPEQFGYYPDLKDCSKYYVCVFGDSLHEKCTGGLFFSLELQTCDWQRNVECAKNDDVDKVEDVEIEDEVFSPSRRTSATAVSNRQPSPNVESVSNYQSDDRREYSRSNTQRDKNSSRPRTLTRTTQNSDAVTQNPDISGPKQTNPPPLHKSSKPAVPADKPKFDSEPQADVDPLYHGDERIKVSDPLDNYDPQQPDFDEAAPPIVDSDGVIHIADGGHGLDAFAGLAHLPGLGDYSVIAKPIYNANSGTSEERKDGDADYSTRNQKANSGPSRNSPVSTKPRSLDGFQSNNGRSKDPDIVIDYTSGAKEQTWRNANEQRKEQTLPPTIFDDSADHRDYGRFDIITPLKTNIQADHDAAAGFGRVNSQNEAKIDGSQSNYNNHGRIVAETAIPDITRLNDKVRSSDSVLPNVLRDSSRISSNDAQNSEASQKQRPADDSNKEKVYDVNVEISRLSENFYETDQNGKHYNYGSLTIYRPPKEIIRNEAERIPEPPVESISHQSDHINALQNKPQINTNVQTQDKSNNRNIANPEVEVYVEKEYADPSAYERKPRIETLDGSLRQLGGNNGNHKDPDVQLLKETGDASFGLYTGSQRQNRKIESGVDDKEDIDNSKVIIPAESIQPSVRQPNQIQRPANKEKEIQPVSQDQSHVGYVDEYDVVNHEYVEYDSKPRYTDDYYTYREEKESLPKSTTPYKARPTRPRRPITTTTTTTTSTTPAPIRIRSRRPINQATPPSNVSIYVATTPVPLPFRPDSVFATPAPYTLAQKCDPRKCRLPDCRCGGTDIPGGLAIQDIPQIVVLTFDDAVNELNHDLYDELFNTGRLNPNGCPILGTFYVSHEWTDYGHVQTLYSNGHEIASHSITHSYGEKFSKNQWMREIHGQREVLHLYGGVKLEDIRGMRAPFLQIGGNKMFEMLFDANFTYDSSMPVYENNPPFWPYTLDYALNHECMIFPCPSKTYPGLWEVGMVMWVDLRGGRCSMGDACSNPPDEEAVVKMLLKNFHRHYRSNKAPFGLFYHSAWFNTQHHRRGFMKFLDEILKKDDVYLVTNWQLIQWMREPTPLSKMTEFEPFNCRRLDRPPPCPTPTVCNVWYQGGVRYMKTCQPCPAKYPWVGNTGYDKKRG